MRLINNDTHVRRSEPRHLDSPLASTIRGPLLFSIIVCALFTATCDGATKFWIGGATGNFADNTRWSTTSGGGNDTTSPGSGDIATFTSLGVGNCDLAANVNVAGMNIQAGYTGTVTQNSGITFTVGASHYSQADGAFVGGNARIDINGRFALSSGSFTSTSGIMTVGRNANSETIFTISGGTFLHNNGTMTFDPIQGGNTPRTFTIDVVTTLTLNNIVINATRTASTNATVTTGGGDTLIANGTFTHSDGILGGSWEVLGNAIFGPSPDGSGGTVTFTGTTNQTYAYTSGDASHIIVNKASGSVSAAVGTTDFSVSRFTLTQGTFTAPSDNFKVGRDANSETIFSIAAGTFNHNNGTVTFDPFQGGNTPRTFTIDVVSTLTLNNVVVDANQSATTSPTVTVAGGDTLIASGTFTHARGRLGGAWEVLGNVTLSPSPDGGGGTVTFTGSADQTYFYTAGEASHLRVNKPSGTVSPAAGTTTLSADLFTLTLGTFTAPTGNFKIGRNANSETIFTVSAGTFLHNSGTITFDSIQSGNTARTFAANVPTTLTLNNIVVNVTKTNATNGTFTTASGDTLVASGNFTHSDGVLKGTFVAQGNVTIGSGADGGNATLTFTGTADQTYTDLGGNEPDGNYTVNKTSGTVSLESVMQATGAGQNVTITQGTLDLNGFNLTVTNLLTVASNGILRLEGGETVTPNPTLNAGSTVIYDGQTGPYTINDWNYRNLSFERTGTVFQLGATESIAEVLTITNGIFSLNGNDLTVTGNVSNLDTLRLHGSETLTLTTGNDTDSGTIEYVGDADGLADTFALKNLTYFNLLVNFTDALDVLPPSGLVSLTINGTLVVNGGTFNTPATVTVTGLTSVTGGTLQAGVTLNTYNGGLTVSSGTFTGNAGTVDINGNFMMSNGTFTAPSSFMTVSGTFSHTAGSFLPSTGQVELDGNGQAIVGSTTFNDFKKVIAATETLTFGSGTTQIFLGTLELRGISGALLLLRSSSAGTQWSVSPQGARNISFVNVQDGANLTLPIINPPSSINAGNNSNWFNPVPIALDDAYDAQQDTVLSVPAPGLLTNDTDVDNDPLNAISGTGPSNGTVTISPDGSFIYTPNPGFSGTDSFTYQANDGPSNSNVGTVVITVRLPIDPIPSGSPTVIALGDSTALFSNPVGGTGAYVAFSWSGPGGFTSTAQNPGIATPIAAGLSFYTVTVTDSAGFSGTATVTISVIESALTPNASATPSVIPLGDSFELTSTPTGGTGVYISFFWTGPNGYTSSSQNPGTLTPSLPGPAAYTLTITDASGLVATETVNIIVGQPSTGVLVKKGKATYRVFSESNAEKPLDRFKVTFLGVDIEAGDKVALLFNNVNIGDLTTGDGLTMERKLKAIGQLGSGSHVFHKCRAKYRARNRRFTFIAQKGVADRNGKPLVQATSGTSEPVIVALLIDQAPADGIIDLAIVVPISFKVRVSNKRSGAIREQGRKINR